MILKSGTTIYRITSTSETYGYLILHRGIAFEANTGVMMCVHYTFDGGLEVITLEEYLQNRKELLRKSYTLVHDVNLDELVKQKQEQQFNYITNNCETFTNDFINNHTDSGASPISQQVVIWAIIVGLVVYKSF